jgi:hypothetical protein
MNPEIISKAIQNLSEGSEFTFTNLDLDSLIFLNDAAQPTKAEIQAEIKKVIKEEEKAEADKLAAKQSAQAKLAALGLTEEEVASILG